MRYNEKGFVDGLPLASGDWRKLAPDQPPGIVLTAGVAPPGLLMIDNYLSKTVCDELAADCEKARLTPCTVYNPKDGDGAAYRATVERVLDLVELSDLGIDLVRLVKSAFAEVVGPHYRKQLRSFERPEVLRYRTGGHYVPHADAESWSKTTFQWSRSVDRDISLLVYFNDGYEGGELVFPNFGFSISPRKGLLVAFPSDHRYAHCAMEVKSGVRYVIASWAAAKGAARVETEARAAVINF
jgi:predicted 2-oxoglutarate/Fe(II)-dependent dioxygenase YbiX